MESKHTRGEFELSNNGCYFDVKCRNDERIFSANVFLYRIGKRGEVISISTSSENKSNAKLIADAFNVANETGMTPRELQASHKELVEALKEYLRILKASPIRFVDTEERLEQALKNATK